MSVSRVLVDLGYQATPGKKSVCPKCLKHTLSVHKADTFAKCFNPACGHVVSAQREALSRVERLVEFVYGACEQTATNPGAEYLVSQRGCVWDVVCYAGVRFVPSTLLPLLQQQVVTDRTAILAEQEARKGDRATLRKLQDAAALYEQAATKLLALFGPEYRRCVGWIMFPYRDAMGRLCGFKLRNPDHKEFRMFVAPGSVTGLFGVDLVSSDDKDLILCEGEINALQLQSLVHRLGYAPAPVVAFGGASGPDAKTIFSVCRKPTIWYDRDVAGEASVSLLAMRGSIYKCCAPNEGDDLDSFIRGFGNEYDRAYEAVKDIIAKRELVHRDFRGTVDEINAIRALDGRGEGSLRTHEINQKVFEVVLRECGDRGYFVFTEQGNEAFLFDEIEHTLIPLQKDGTKAHYMLDRLLYRCGLVLTEAITSYVISALASHARTNGKCVVIHKHVFYDDKTNTVYWHDGSDKVYKVTADGWELVKNGHDSVLFLQTHTAHPFTYVPKERRDPKNTLVNVIFDGLRINLELHPEKELVYQKVVLWFYSLFFPRMMKTRPIMLFVGPKGSGKTLSLQKLGSLLTGDEVQAAALTTMDNAEALLSNQYFVLLDNVDGYYEWLDNLLAVVSTGGAVTRRELYTTNKLASYVYNTFVAISARTPTFRRDDVADRLLIVNLLRVGAPGAGWMAPELVLRRTMQARSDVCSEIIDTLQQILAALRSTPENTLSTIRSGDYGRFCIRAAGVFGGDAAIRRMLFGVSMEQTHFATEDDPTADAFRQWVREVVGAADTREYTARDIYAILRERTLQVGAKWEWRERSFAQWIPTVIDSLDHSVRAVVRLSRDKTKLYSFRRGEDAFHSI